LRRTAQPSDAHDAVSETFLTAWRRRDDLAKHEDPLPWLYGVARRVLANQRRAGRRRERLEAKLAGERAGADGVEPVESLDQPVLRALRRLRPLDQEVLRLVAWEGLTPARIAAVLGCSANAAAIKLHRARKRLREELEKASRPAGQFSNGSQLEHA
jgi:RNA polymerase sigma-70 factor (ECF subfamily)